MFVASFFLEPQTAEASGSLVRGRPGLGGPGRALMVEAVGRGGF